MLSQSRLHLMPASRQTRIELHGKMINSQEVKIKTLSKKSMMTLPIRTLRFKVNMTREKERTKDSTNLLNAKNCMIELLNK